MYVFTTNYTNIQTIKPDFLRLYLKHCKMVYLSNSKKGDYIKHYL